MPMAMSVCALLLSALLYLLMMIELRKPDFRGKISCSESVSIGQ